MASKTTQEGPRRPKSAPSCSKTASRRPKKLPRRPKKKPPGGLRMLVFRAPAGEISIAFTQCYIAQQIAVENVNEQQKAAKSYPGARQEAPKRHQEAPRAALEAQEAKKRPPRRAPNRHDNFRKPVNNHHFRFQGLLGTNMIPKRAPRCRQEAPRRPTWLEKSRKINKKMMPKYHPFSASFFDRFLDDFCLQLRPPNPEKSSSR